ncbi:mitochondrial coenzyme transporter [Salix suchowensis]|nr:mitochondrial coenzyme transporter [Salix suchowensis]
MAGIAAASATYPLDLVRTRIAAQDLVRRRMQLEGAGGRAPVYTSGLFGTFANIIRTEGFRGMYRGILPPSTARVSRILLIAAFNGPSDRRASETFQLEHRVAFKF